MSFMSWLADRLILCPTTYPIDVEAMQRRLINTENGKVEAWVASCPSNGETACDLSLVKFPGTSGRAERGGIHPAELFDMKTMVWTINPHGYGGSEGQASIKKFPEMANSVLDHVKEVADHDQMIVYGNSLGCITALYCAARFDVKGLIIRNPPPLQEMIRTRPRYCAWNFGFSKFIADQVPEELDAIKNASLCSVPCFLVQSAEDRIVPVSYQDQICEAYNGPIEKFVIPGAGHDDIIEDQQHQEYIGALRRFIDRAMNS